MTPGPISEEISSSISTIVRRQSLVSRVIKIGFIFVGTALSGIFAVLASEGWPPNKFALIAVAGAVLALVGGVISTIMDVDPMSEIDLARRAALEAEEHQRISARRYELLVLYDRSKKQLESLYTTMLGWRHTIEQAASLCSLDGRPSEIDIILQCLDATEQPLRVALDFEMDEFWTLCVYQTQRDKEKEMPFLKCVAHARADTCPIEDARVWPYGVGIGGVALAKFDQVVAPDLDAEEAGSVFRVGGGVDQKPTDSYRYKSMFAVPISVGEDVEPWGVVVATSSRRKHFGKPDVEGVKPEEAVRAVAELSALAVAVCQSNRKSTHSGENV